MTSPPPAGTARAPLRFALPLAGLSASELLRRRVLPLLLVWGLGLFLWGTLDAWARHNQLRADLVLLQSQDSATRAWLDKLAEPARRLAADQRTQMGASLPNGVLSMPIRRVLYEFAYFQLQNDVYALDLADGSLNHPLGASPLPAPVVDRLRALAPEGGTIIADGLRSGTLYLIAKVDAPPPHRIYVIVPTPAAQAAADRPTPDMGQHHTLGLALPHVKGWAWWPTGSGAFSFSAPLDTALERDDGYAENDDGTTVFSPLAGHARVYLGLFRDGGLLAKALIPQIVLLLWMLAMTTFLLLPRGNPLRSTVAKATSPLLGRIGGFASPLVSAMASWHDSVREQVLSPIEKDPPLVSGPGAFSPGDFTGGNLRVRPASASAPAQGGGFHLKPGSGPAAAGPAPAGAAAASAAARKAGGAPAPASSPAPNTPLRPEDLLPPQPESSPAPPEEDLDAVVRQCIRENRIVLLYQPIYRASDGKPVLHEIYARLVRADGRVMSPGEFLPVCDRLGLTQDLDAAVFRKTLTTYFFAAVYPSTPLALNIGGNSLDSIGYLQELLSHGPHVLQRLAFEVRSQEIVRDPKALKLIKDIQRNGGSLAVDYFGGGNAMLEASKNMGFDYIKIDCSRFMGSPESQGLLTDLCAHATRIGLPVIMEKIGTPDDERFVRGAGAAYLQGYALAMPDTQLATAPLAPRASAAQAPTLPPSSPAL